MKTASDAIATRISAEYSRGNGKAYKGQLNTIIIPRIYTSISQLRVILWIHGWAPPNLGNLTVRERWWYLPFMVLTLYISNYLRGVSSKTRTISPVTRGLCVLYRYSVHRRAERRSEDLTLVALFSRPSEDDTGALLRVIMRCFLCQSLESSKKIVYDTFD